MIRSIAGFSRSSGDGGEWVAELSCLHRQHVRHRPPFQERAWVLDPSGRAGRIGSPIECSLCDRPELPDGLVILRTAGPWDQDSLPAALLGTHRTPDGRWGRIRVLDGAVDFQLVGDGAPDGRCVHLEPGSAQLIPPEAAHRLVLVGPVRFELELWGRPPGR